MHTESSGAQTSVDSDDAQTSTSSACDAPPPPEPEREACDITALPEARVEVEGISPMSSDATMLCTVDAITALPDPELDPELVVELRCSSPERGRAAPTIRVMSDDMPTLRLSSGDEVLLGFAGGGLFDEVFLTLRRPDGTLLLAWIDAMWLPTADEPSIPSAMFLSPLALARDPQECGSVCDPAAEGCLFIEDPCPCTHRLALDVGVGDEQRRIVDGDRATFGDGLTVHVVHASTHASREGVGCFEGPRFAVLATGGGSR